MTAVLSELVQPEMIPLRLVQRSTELRNTAADLFQRHFYKKSANCFWLDSSRVIDGLSRFSILGNTDGPNSETLLVDAETNHVHLHSGGGKQEIECTDAIDWLNRRIQQWSLCNLPALQLPFVGGYVGYLGYEAKRLTCGHTGWCAPTWDVGLMFADRFLIIDHKESILHAVAIGRPGDGDAPEKWTSQILEGKENIVAPNRNSFVKQYHAEPVSFRMRHDRAAYIARINAALEAIRAGESYEVCLTNEISCSNIDCDPLDIYLELRVRNPAPYGAFLQIGATSIACSSPERFLRCDSAGNVETKPIKGTSARSKDPAEDSRLAKALQADEKSRSENLMITDLLRNDLSRVCEVGSVHVPALMQIETYETVHQLVTTVRGKLTDGKTAVDCVSAAFPGGSMTGAPKLRTLDIIDALEGGARGVYSGCLGWIGIDGSADLNIIIRTIVIQGTTATIGVGGAIVAMSNSDDEFEEMLLKARPSLAAISATLCGRPDAYVLHGVDGGNDVEISEPQPYEAQFLLSGLRSLIAETTGNEPEEVDESTRLLLLSALDGTINTRVLVARRKSTDGIVGFVTWSVAQALGLGGQYASIEDVWVSPSFRSEGIDSRLIDAVIVRCGALGIKIVELCLPQRHGAELQTTEQLYARMGFTPVGRRMRHVTM